MENRLRLSPATQLTRDELQVQALERIAWRKMDRWVLPICTVFYLLSFLDRSNVANARVAGLQRGLNMSNTQYSIALTVTYVPYIIAEFPSNILLKRVGPNIMLPSMVAIWGVVTTLQGTVTTYGGLLACRFFLGLVEGDGCTLVSLRTFPGLVLYLSFFYPRDRLQIRVSTFFASASLAGAFSGLLAAAIIKMDGIGGRPGWAWIFILEGLFTFLLKQDGAIAVDEEHDGFGWNDVVKSFKSPHVLLVAAAFFFNGTTLYGLAYFEPSIVAGFGYSGARAQLMSVPPFCCDIPAIFHHSLSLPVSLISAVLSDRYHCRGLVATMFSLLCLIGLAMFLGFKSNDVRYGSLFLSVPGTYCVAPALSTWMANNSAPYVRRATSIAIGFIMTNSGGILATWLLGSLSPAPDYRKATTTFVIMSALMAILSALNIVYLSRQNRTKAEKRRIFTLEQDEDHAGDRSAWFEYSL
ncbi:MFS general substrate transporter [Coniophora puteana RWD-64-598 SS2]|uniref:MFS general substrate transporter n=1 Tax=Coniophora puteana (strain RWD-64-598) TaxID=741705 RepID=A0A5M3N145_CONPW|nr:MFS general substrate transporter [Coniophora puteana RWD-64-598 SS2]EIW85122.1 MFS general substrate transporter [Coniophora puteana RWD-64-598 SS2]